MTEETKNETTVLNVESFTVVELNEIREVFFSKVAYPMSDPRYRLVVSIVSKINLFGESTLSRKYKDHGRQPEPATKQDSKS